MLRLSMSVAAALLAAQSLTAGLFLSGEMSAFDLHREMATAAGIVILIGVVFGALCARLRGESWKPTLWGIGLLALMSLQAFAGFRSLTVLHIPLGVATILAGVWVTWRVWRAPASLVLPCPR